jgi:hypothetical protein
MSTLKKHRFAEFLNRLKEAPHSSTFGEASSQINNIMNEVENTFTTIPYNPENWQNDGRLYPPESDNIYDVDAYPKIKRLRSRGHNTYIGGNGSIEIQTTDGMIVFEKTGTDGKNVWNFG